LFLLTYWRPKKESTTLPPLVKQLVLELDIRIVFFKLFKWFPCSLSHTAPLPSD
jgi:hypothetical protein